MRVVFLLLHIVFICLVSKLQCQIESDRAVNKNERGHTHCLKNNEVSIFIECLEYYSNTNNNNEILNLISNIDSINTQFNYLNHFKSLYSAFKYAYGFTYKYDEHKLNLKITSELNSMIKDKPNVLLEDLLELSKISSIKDYDLQRFLKEFGFYLFKEEAELEDEFEKVDKVVFRILSKLTDVRLLKLELENLKIIRLQVGEGVKLVYKKVFDDVIYYNIKSVNLKDLEDDFVIDTFTVFDYYPLQNWKEPIFILHKPRFEDDDILNDELKILLNYRLYGIINKYG